MPTQDDAEQAGGAGFLIRFDLDPVARPRMTRKDRWAKRPVVVRYYDYTEDLRKLAMAADWEPGDALFLMFVLPMAASWSKKKKAELGGTPHQLKPDLDNLVKGFLDAFGEDRAVWKVNAEKWWADPEPNRGYIFALNLGAADVSRETPLLPRG